MSDLFVRRATKDDAALLSELGARTFAETFASDNTAANMAAYLAESFTTATQLSELTDPDTTVKIAEINGEAVGYSMLSTGNTPEAVVGQKPIELVRLYVSKQCIGKGVGAALMKECVEEAASLGHQTIWLGVWEHNYRAQAFYRKWGFVVVGTHIFQLGDDAQRDLLMQRDLAK